MQGLQYEECYVVAHNASNLLWTGSDFAFATKFNHISDSLKITERYEEQCCRENYSKKGEGKIETIILKTTSAYGGLSDEVRGQAGDIGTSLPR